MNANNGDVNLIPVKDNDRLKDQCTTARLLYEFLELETTNFPKWYRKNILRNPYFQEGLDYAVLVPIDDNKKGGRPMQDAYITLNFAKHLCLLSKSRRGHQAREYFIAKEREANKPENRFIRGEETAKLFNNLLEAVSQYSPTARLTVGAQIMEEVYGIVVPSTALPPAREEEYSATDIAKLLDYEVTPHKIGKIAKQLGLNRPPFAQRRLSIGKYSKKEVGMYYYGIEAKDKLMDYFRPNAQLL